MNHSRQDIRERTNTIINIIMIFLVIVSITLTIIESAENIMTPELRNIFLAAQTIILSIFLCEFFYRLWDAPRLISAKSSFQSRLKFLASPLTIIDMIVIAPLFIMIWTHDVHEADIVILRILRFTSILNLFHFYRSSRVVKIIREMSKEIWYEMLIITIIALQCILISGVIFYLFEHDRNLAVKNIFDGIWWSITTISTIGYGDVYPMTFGGRIVGIFLAFVGIGVVALPTGILTSAFIRALHSEKGIGHLIRNMKAEEKEQDEIVERIDVMEKKISKKVHSSSPKTHKKKTRK